MKLRTETKEDLIRNALLCFTEYGFEEATFKQIAEKSKIAQPSMYNHFKNKMHLISECALWAAERGRVFIDSRIDQKKPARGRLAQYIRANFLFFQKHPLERYAITSLYFMGQTNAEMKAAYDVVQNAGLDRIETFLVQHAHETKMPLKSTPTFAIIVHNLLVGEIYKLIFAVGPTKIDTRVERVMLTVDQLFKIE